MSVPRVARARQAWRKLRRVLGRPGVVEGISINDNFANLVSDVPALLATRQPLWVGVQEGLRSTFRRLLGIRWGVRQRLTSEATRGVAVIWDRLRFRALRGHIDKPHRRGHGWKAIADSAETRMRGVVWQDGAVRRKVAGVRLLVRLGSTHRFPQRDKEHWPEFDMPLVAWILVCPDDLHLVLFMDCNEDGGPSHLLELLEEHAPGRYRWIGQGIDGCITDLDDAAIAEVLAQATSDHKPVSIPFDLTKETR